MEYRATDKCMEMYQKRRKLMKGVIVGGNCKAEEENGQKQYFRVQLQY